MKCPYCNADNDETAVFCGECGNKIKIDAQKPQMEDDLWTENMTFSWTPDQNQTQNQQYGNGVPPVYTPPEPKKNNTLIFIILGICFVAVIGLCIVLGVNLLSKNEKDTQVSTEQTEATTEAENTQEDTEESDEKTTEEVIEYLNGVDPSNTADFTNNLSTDSYIVMSGDDSTLSFAYPKNFFASDTEGENDYTFYSSDGSVILRYWKEEGGSVSTLTSEFYSKKAKLNTSSKDGNGVERYSGIAMDWSDKDIPHYVLGGRYTTDLNKGYYSVASLRNGAIYHMEFEYPVDNNNSFANPVNYMIDCLYRYCGFSGSSSAPRSYQEFQAAN